MTPDFRFAITDGQSKSSESSAQKGSKLAHAPAWAGGSEYVETALAELVKILDAELYQYRELLNLLQAQRESLAASDIAFFEETSKQQGTVVLKVKTLEEARKSIISRLAQYYDVPSERLTLGKLATLVDGQYGERCTEYQKDILSLIKDLENLRESNAYLIQQALHYVSGVLRIFASTNSTNSTDFAYSDDGQREHKSKKGKYVSGWG